jgi:hypothetical protein
MPAEARIAPIWKKQKLFVALFLMALGGWFFLDGFRNYPRSNERWLAHQEYVDKKIEREWPEFARSRGWETEPPHKFFKPSDIAAQYVFGTLGVVLGGIILAYWATQIRCVLKMDDEAVYSPAGTRVPFEAITGVGKKKWDTKGIAKVRYELGGRKGEFVVDDYKFDTEPARQILATIEEKLVARTPGKSV